MGINKCDIIHPDNLPADRKEIIQKLVDPSDFNEKAITYHCTSTVTGDGLMALRNDICEDLLAKRVHDTLKSKTGSAKTELMDRLRVAKPVKRDEIVREAFVPAGWKNKKKAVPNDKVVLGPLPKQPFVVQEKVEGAKKTE